MLALLAAAPALGCDVADTGSAPLRAAIAAVKHLPETEAWEKSLPASVRVQFVLHLDQPRTVEGRCHWTLDVRADGTLWKRFLVMPGGWRAFVQRDGQ